MRALASALVGLAGGTVGILSVLQHHGAGKVNVPVAIAVALLRR
jgi:hypothetical protein